MSGSTNDSEVIPSSWTVAKVRDRFSCPTEEAFFVTTQDGYESGIALPEQLREFSESAASRLLLGQIARAIRYVDAIRDIDPLFAALNYIERHRSDYLTVLDSREYIVGVLRRKQLAKFLGNKDASRLNLSSRSIESEYRKAA